MGIETAIMGGMSLLGGLAGSQKSGQSSQSQSSSTQPWAVQQPYLQYGFDATKNATQNALNNPVYTGQRVADLNGIQNQAIGYANDFQNQAFGRAGDTMRIGSDLMGTGAQFGNNAASLFNQYSGDPTQTILANANQYANNPYVNGLVDASSRDVTRNLYENQLPTLAKAAAGSGNTNSTRAGVADAIAQRGAADRLADISSQIRSQFFGQGLSQAQNQYNQNLQNSLAANNQLSNAYTQGLNGMNNGMSLANNAYSLAMNAGNAQQANEQAKLTAAMNQFNEGNTNPLAFLTSYMNNVGKNYGQSSTSTTENAGTGGGWQGALGGALGGLASGYGMRNAFGSGNLGSSLQAAFSNTGLGSSGFGTGLAYGNQDMGQYL